MTDYPPTAQSSFGFALFRISFTEPSNLKFYGLYQIFSYARAFIRFRDIYIFRSCATSRGNFC